MEKIRTLRGFRDIIGEEIGRFRRIEETARRVFGLFGYRELETPILEKTDLFVRSIGDTTDIVEKEMFTFTDAGGDSVTLRPEATAGVVRAYLQESLHAKERVTKLFTIGSMFRHERPQKGRFRGFHQVDVEAFGVAGPFLDAEQLWMIKRIVDDLNVLRFDMEINSVGCPLCREPFRKVLVSYFEGKRGDLCDDCIRRLDRNPLRIFDCKVERCGEVSRGSPLLFDHLCRDCRIHFETLKEHLKDFGVSFAENRRLVRGLDYYTRTVFEITSEDLGSQKAFIAGGRYDRLVEEMGGPPTPAIGFAIGMERLALLCPPAETKKNPLFFLAYLGDEAKARRIPLLKALGQRELPLSYSYEDKSLKAQMRYADSLGADYVLILGGDEIQKGLVIVRNMATKAQYELPLEPVRLVEGLLRIVTTE